MIYSDWRFCQNIQLTPDETAEFLNLLFVLREKGSGLPEKIAALEKLGQSDALCQTYAVPVLADQLFLPESREWLDGQEDRRGTDFFRTSVRARLHELTERRGAEARDSARLSGLINELDTIENDRLLDWFRQGKAFRYDRADNVYFYLETNQFAEEILYLSLLRRLGAEFPNEVQNLLGTSLKSLFQACRSGRLGLLPQRLAFEILLDQDTDFDTILRDLPEDWLSYPEYMELLAKAELSSGAGGLFERIQNEITGLSVFQRRQRTGIVPREPLWFGNGETGGEKEVLCALLWQSVLWEWALDVHAERCADAADKLWYPPAYGYAKERSQWDAMREAVRALSPNWIVNELAKKFGPLYLNPKTPREDHLEILRRAICTPWQRCGGKKDADRQFQAFPGMKKMDGAFRALSSAVLLRRIFLRCPGACWDADAGRLRRRTLLHLILNLGCALESAGPREERDSSLANHEWSDALRGMGSFAWQGLTLLGTGMIFRELPDQLWQEFQNQINLQNRGDSKLNPQLSAIYGERGLLLCAHWAVYAQAYHMANRMSGSGSPWEDTETIAGLAPASYSAKLCGRLFAREEDLSRTVRESTDAMHLYCKSGRAHTGQPSAAPWYQRVRQGLDREESITIYDLLREPIPEASFWEQGIRKECFTAEAWQYALTLRLQAFLEEDCGGPAWFTEWYRELAQNGDLQRYPIVFYALMRLLTCTPRESVETKDCLDRILSLIIETVDIYTDEANAFYQYRLSECLAAAKPEFGIWNLHKACASHLLALQRLSAGAKYVEDLQYLFTWNVLGKFAELDEQGVELEGRSFRDVLEKQRIRTSVNALNNNYAAREIASRDWNPLLDRFAQQNGRDGLLQTARLQIDLTRAENGFAEEPPPQEFSYGNVGRPPVKNKKLGIVESKVWTKTADFRQRQPRNESEYVVMLGDERQTGVAGLPFHMGDLVFFDKSKKPERIYSPAWQWRESGDILRVWIKEIHAANGISLRMTRPTANGERLPELYPPEKPPKERKAVEALLNLWAPDTCSYENGFAPVHKKVCEAIYDTALGYYVPVERNFFRLMLDAFYGKEFRTAVARLWFISVDYTADGVRSALFSLIPGYNYRLTEQDWDAASAEKLEEMLFQEPEANMGAAVWVRLGTRNGFPQLSLSEEQPFDMQNREWAELFEVEQGFAVNRGETGLFQAFRTFEGKQVAIGAEFVREGQTRNPDPRAGFGPDKPAYTPAGNSENVELAEDGWSLTQQRLRRVRLRPYKNNYVTRQWLTTENVRAVLNLSAGSPVVLDRVLPRDDQYIVGYRRAFLRGSGIPVYCAADSLSLSPAGLLSLEMTQGRQCVLEYIWRGRAKETDAVPVPLKDLPDGQNEAMGLVSNLPALHGTSSGLIIKVALPCEGRESALEIEIPASAFSVLPRRLGNRVLLRRSAEGWTAQAELEELYVRALWRTDMPEDGKPVGDALGILMVGRDYRKYCVFQDRSQPVLHLWPEKLGQDAAYGRPDVTFGAQKGHVSAQSRPRYYEKNVFRYSAFRSVAWLAAGDIKLWGETDTGNFSKPSNAWRMSMQVFELPDHADAYRYDVRRLFSPRAAASAETGDKKPETQRQEADFQWYQEWYSGVDQWADSHLRGRLDQFGRFVYSDHKMPEYAVEPAASVMERWVSNHPLMQENPLWVRRRYPPRARAKMLAYQGSGDDRPRWYASCKLADPFLMDEPEKLLSEFHAEPGDLIQNFPMYFAGVDEQEGQLRFEWGYGYTLLVDRDRVIDTNGLVIGTDLFFGDCLLAYRIKEVEGAWSLNVPPDAIRREIVSYLWKDAGMLNLVQLIKVHVDRVSGKVEILEISRVQYDVGEGGSLNNRSWYFEKLNYGRMEEESKRLLLKETEEEQADRLIFALLLDQDDAAARQREPRFHYISLNRADELPLLNDKTVCLVAGSIETNRETGGQNLRDVRSRGRRNNRSALGNDYFIRFYLQTELPLKGNETQPHIMVSVNRRSFSLDESKLRVLYDDDRESFLERNMLVRLKQILTTQEHSSTWRGVVKGICVRNPNSLKEWVQSNPACLVTLGDVRNRAPEDAWDETIRLGDTVRVEVAPGITSVVDRENIVGRYRQGATARLQIDSGVLKAYVILPGDEEYIPEEGNRVAELLVMDGAAKQYAEDPDGVNTKSHFTVASFPQIVLSNPGLLSDLIQSGWPRLGLIHRDGQFSYAQKTPQAHKSACILLTEENQPLLRDPHSPDAEPVCASWSQLSFMDASSGTIAEAVQNGAWHYHDWTYGVYHAETGKLDVRKLPASSTDYRNILVFPDSDNSLRLKPAQFKSLGYSAREIVENGLPVKRTAPAAPGRLSGARTERTVRHQYAVAGADDSSIWIEVFPGRIVEIPRQFLFVTGSMIDLDRFPIRILSAGDEITLDQDMSFEGGQRRLIAMRFRYGLRSRIKERQKAVLPVLDVLPDGVVVGSACWKLTYPVADSSAFEKGKTAVLEPGTNILTPGGALSRGELVMLGMDRRGVPFIRGFEGITAYPSRYENDWLEAAWLRDLLDCSRSNRRRFQARRDFFEALNSDIPVTITNYDESKKLLWYAYDQREQLAGETMLYCACLGLLSGDAEHGEPQMLLRAGSLLLRVNCQELFPNLSKTVVKAIVRTLRAQEYGIWIHRANEQEPWHSGTHLPMETQVSNEVELLFNLPDAQGILCQARNNLQMKWLPYTAASRVDYPWPDKKGDRFGEQIWAALQKSAAHEATRSGRRRAGEEKTPVLRKVRALEGCTVSLLNVDMKKTDEQWLAAGTKLRVTPLVPLNRPASSADAQDAAPEAEEVIRYCIAEVYPQGELIRLDSERLEFQWEKPQPILAEVLERRGLYVRASESGMRRIVQNLSPEFYRAYGDTRNESGQKIARIPEQDLHLNRWKLYQSAFDKATQDVETQRSIDTKDRNVDPDHFCSRDAPDMALIYLFRFYRTCRRDGGHPSAFWRRQVCAYLKAWMEKNGEPLLLDSCVGAKLRHRTIDTVPALTAALLLHAVGPMQFSGQDARDAWRLAAHMARVLGLLSEASVHEEILTRFWLDGPRESESGAWARLQRVSIIGETSDGTRRHRFFDGKLSTRQYQRLVTLCRNVLQQNLPDEQLNAVARSFLYSVRQLDNFDEFEKNLHALNNTGENVLISWNLALVGRTLIPREGDEIAYQLQPPIFQNLNNIWMKFWSIPYMPLLRLREPLIWPHTNEIRGIYERCIAALANGRF